MKIDKLTTIIIAVMISTSTLFAQRFNETLLPTVKLSPFDAVEITGTMRVELIPSPIDQQPRIVYDLDDTNPKQFSFKVDDNGVLLIQQKHNSTREIGVVTLRLYYREISRLSVNQSSVVLASPLKRENDIFDLTISGGAVLSGEIICGDVSAEVLTQSELTIGGDIKYLTLKASDKSKVELRDLETLSANITTTQSAVVALKAPERLVASANSSSTIKYWGVPTIMRADKFLHGAITKMD